MSEIETIVNLAKDETLLRLKDFNVCHQDIDFIPCQLELDQMEMENEEDDDENSHQIINYSSPTAIEDDSPLDIQELLGIKKLLLKLII